MNTAQINQAILSGSFSNDDLNSIINAVQFARQSLASKNRHTIGIGSTVKWNSARAGMMMQGTVLKINRKNVVVKTGNDTWNVPANMLSAA